MKNENFDSIIELENQQYSVLLVVKRLLKRRDAFLYIFLKLKVKD